MCTTVHMGLTVTMTALVWQSDWCTRLAAIEFVPTQWSWSKNCFALFAQSGYRTGPVDLLQSFMYATMTAVTVVLTISGRVPTDFPQRVPTDSNALFCDHLRTSLTNVKDKSSDAPIFLFSDFNYPHFNWSFLAVANQSPWNERKQFLDLVLDFNLHQTITTPTRGDTVLDLLLTNCPDDVSGVTVLPGFSDHNLHQGALSMPLKRRSPTKKLITDYIKGNFELINKEFPRYYENFKVVRSSLRERQLGTL